MPKSKKKTTKKKTKPTKKITEEPAPAPAEEPAPKPTEEPAPKPVAKPAAKPKIAPKSKVSKESSIQRLKNYLSKGEGGSWLYGIILMVAGGFVIALGILDLFNITFLHDFLIFYDQPGIAAMLPTLGVTNFVIGAFAVIAGVGLIIDQEWGWGIAMVILVYTAAQSIVYLVNSATELSISPSSINALGVLVASIAATAVAVIGLAYLGLTKYKYA